MSMMFLDFPGGGGEPISNDEPRTEPTKTPAEILAEQNAARAGEVAGAADVAGSFVSGAEQARVDEIYAGVLSGKYSVDDALGALSNIEAAGRAAFAGSGDDDTTGDDDTISLTQGTSQDSRALLGSYLAKYGLETLADQISELMARGIESESAVLFELRETEAYKKRFAANAKRVAAGLSQLTPGSYIELEETYRRVMKSNGMDRYFNRQDIIENLLSGDVSPQELQARIADGYRRVQEADAATRTQMRELYGVQDADLAAYFLNPAETMPILTRRAEAAKLAARAKEQGGMQLTALTAEELAARGISETQAFETFGTMSQRRGLYETLGGEEDLSMEQRLGAAFGYDPEAQKRLADRAAARRAEFQAGGRFASTTGATSGTIETGAGMAR
jgi:hypothetical protein